jgi:hypothetical protein
MLVHTACDTAFHVRLALAQPLFELILVDVVDHVNVGLEYVIESYKTSVQ